MTTTQKLENLTAIARAAFTAIKADAPNDHFYFFALYTTADGGYVIATAWSEEALERTVSSTTARGKQTTEQLARALRFSAGRLALSRASLRGIRRPPGRQEAA